jgi:hypothetical protein
MAKTLVNAVIVQIRISTEFRVVRDMSQTGVVRTMGVIAISTPDKKLLLRLQSLPDTEDMTIGMAKVHPRGRSKAYGGWRYWASIKRGVFLRYSGIPRASAPA